MADLFHVSDDGGSLLVKAGGYDPGITAEINAKIRNLPQVKKYIDDIAKLLRAKANAGGHGEGFIVIRAGGKSRYRAYVAPDNPEAIEDELRDSVLLKAALSMSGK